MSLDQSEIIKFLKNIHPFRKLNDSDLFNIVHHVIVKEYHHGETVYREGDSSNQLFILYYGQVKITREGEEQEEYFGLLGEGSIFGFEIWKNDLSRLDTMTAADDITILSINWESLFHLTDVYPYFAEFLDMMLDSMLLTRMNKMDWRDADEIVYYLGRTHAFFFWLKVIPSIVVLGFVALPIVLYDFIQWSFPLWSLIAIFIAVFLASGWGLWNYVDWINDFFAITNKRILHVEKVVLYYESRIESPLDSILSVSTTTSYWGRLLKFGKIIIRTYTGTIVWDRLAKITHIASMIEEKIVHTSRQKIQIERQTKVDSIRESLNRKPEISVQKQQETPPQEEALYFWQWLASLFELKTEKQNVIIYHTHWIMLLKHTLLVNIMALGWMLFLFFKISGLLDGIPWSISLVLLSVWFLILVGVWIYKFIDWRNDQYILTEDQIIDTCRKPLGKEEKRTAPIKNILSIEFKRLGIVGLFLNYGTVFIYIGDEEFSFNNVSNPSEVQQEIFYRISCQKQKDKQETMEQERRQMVEWLEAYHQAVQDDGDKQD